MGTSFCSPVDGRFFGINLRAAVRLIGAAAFNGKQAKVDSLRESICLAVETVFAVGKKDFAIKRLVAKIMG